jgi:hypothetical protein
VPASVRQFLRRRVTAPGEENRPEITNWCRLHREHNGPRQSAWIVTLAIDPDEEPA